MTTTAFGLVVQHGFPVAEILCVHLPHGLRLPAQGLGNLRSPQAERASQPDRLDTPVLGFRGGLLEQSSEPLDGSLRKRLACTHLTPPKAGSSLLHSCCSLMANWYQQAAFPCAPKYRAPDHRLHVLRVFPHR